MTSASNLGAGQIICYNGTEEFKDYDVDADAHIYEGDFVGVNAGTGFARKCAAGDEFLGLAVREVYNIGSGYDPARSGDGSAGSTQVRVLSKGTIKKAVTDGATTLNGDLTDIGTSVACSDDRTVNTTTGGNTTIGKIIGLESDGEYLIAIENVGERSV